MEESTRARLGSDDLASAFAALGNATRVALLARLARPAFAPDLAQEFGLTRQALKKHLDILESVGLVTATPARRGVFSAEEYHANPQGLFVFKCAVQGLALPPDPRRTQVHLTLPVSGSAGLGPVQDGAGLLLVYGDAPGRWFTLGNRTSWVLGRDPGNEVALPYDAFASARHALLSYEGGAWRLQDLNATNGTLVNLRPLLPGATQQIHPGDLLTIGQSHLLLRDTGA